MSIALDLLLVVAVTFAATSEAAGIMAEQVVGQSANQPSGDLIAAAYASCSRGEFTQAARMIAPEIAKGADGAPAAWNLQGYLHAVGKGGLVRDQELAFLAFQQAAWNGDPRGQYNLGAIYYFTALHEFTAPDEIDIALRAARFLLASSASEVPASAYLLGLMQARGHAFEADAKAGFLKIHDAALRGNSDAQFFAAEVFRTGRFDDQPLLPPQSQQAEEFYYRAACQGHASSLSALAHLSKDDPVTAYMYFWLAASRETAPNEATRQSIESLETRLSATQIATARQRATAFTYDHPLPPPDGTLRFHEAAIPVH